MMEQKLEQLERRVATLEGCKPQAAAKNNWRDVIGFAKGDELFQEALRLGAELREASGKEGK